MLPSSQGADLDGPVTRPRPGPPGRPMPPGRWFPSGFVLTRLHARYTKEALGEDLVFRAAPPIHGGREVAAATATSSTAPPRAA